MRKYLVGLWFLGTLFLLFPWENAMGKSQLFGVCETPENITEVAECMETPTLRATATLPFSEGTSQSTPSNVSCPPGTPAGWGVVTPNAYWNMVCEGCAYDYSTSTSIPVTPSITPLCIQITEIPQPTTTLGTLVPYCAPSSTPTLTYTPTKTNTPTLTPVPGCLGAVLSGWGTNNGGVNYAYNRISCYQFEIQLYVTPAAYRSGEMTVIYEDGGLVSSCRWKLMSVVSSKGGKDWNLCSSMTHNSELGIDSAYGTAEANNVWYFSHCHMSGLGWIRFNQRVSSDSCGFNPYARWALIERGGVATGGEGYTPTPSNTPTGTPTTTTTPNWGSYCGTVDSADHNSNNWTGITFGPSYCMQVGGWELTIFGQTYGFPLYEFCLQGVSMGVLTFLGVIIDLDTVLMLFVTITLLTLIFLA